MALNPPKHPKYFYKFRGISNLRWLIDIIMRQRLYAARYDELNDPMEGYFLFDKNTSKEIRQFLAEKRKSTGICSLSKNYKNTLMWSFYAEDHKGVCIELAVTTNLWQPIKISYSNKLPTLSGDPDKFLNLLSCKSKHWEYEEEVRFIRTFDSVKKMNSSRFVSIYINKIYLGYKMAPKEVSYFTKLFGNLLPYLKDRNGIEQLRKEDIDTGFDNI